MIGLDTNVPARYYVQDVDDAEGLKQREAARRLMESGRPLMVCKTVLLELEWVMRGYYEFSTAEIAGVMNHLLALPQVTVEDRQGIVQALSHCEAGLELVLCTMPAIEVATAWPRLMTRNSSGVPDAWGWRHGSNCRNNSSSSSLLYRYFSARRA